MSEITVVTAAELAELIRTKAPDFAGHATAESTFDELEVDSLSFVEIAVVVSESYGVDVLDFEVAEAADIHGLSVLIRERLDATGVL